MLSGVLRDQSKSSRHNRRSPRVCPFAEFYHFSDGGGAPAEHNLEAAGRHSAAADVQQILSARRARLVNRDGGDAKPPVANG